eukprot:CAMPEP_0119303158 /NCGR_PEP_ID=MMETSP1333-20130426/4641_1 /TAXON_ID=418940 /ORGANISM="Scyphosphaera apsteinii, Strain RCC1455" /LENGTH=332 /DNA_ID=CAMNT_0007305757 /DNA_START=268 /DNA_END=1266 /DNA_ORIENTATION=-
MSLSFLEACTTRAADTKTWLGKIRVAHLPYLAFEPKAKREHIREVVIFDARASEMAPFDLHRDGFTFIDRKSSLSSLLPSVKDPHDRSVVVNEAYPAAARIIEALAMQQPRPSTWKAVTYSHMHRYTLQCPSYTVHNDYTHPSQGVKQVLKVLEGHEQQSDIERALQLPFFSVNVWTALAPVRRDPLAVCRWNVGRELSDMGYTGQRIGVDEWYWMPSMCRGEAIVFKQFDSVSLHIEEEGQAREGAQDTMSIRAQFTLHTSFREPPIGPRCRGPPPRRSIEYRVIVFEDEAGVLPATFGQTAMDALAKKAAKAAAARQPSVETTGMIRDAA